MTKAEFIAEAKRRGMSKEETLAKFKELDAAGKFSDSASRTEQPAMTAQGSEQTKDGGGMLRGVVRAGQGFNERLADRGERVLAPTALGEAARGAVGGGVPGAIAESVAAIPERFGRTAALVTGTAGDAAAIPTMAGLKLLGKGANAVTGGAAGRVAGRAVSGAAQLPVVSGGVDLAKKAAGWYGKQSPATKANLAATVDLTEAFGLKPAQAITRTGAKTAKGAGRAAGGAAADVAEGAYKAVGSTAEYLGDVPKETLAAYGWGLGKEAKNIQKYAGKQHQIGNKILNALDNLDDYIPEKKVVNEALQKMPDVNVGNTVKKLKSMKETTPGTPSAVAGNKQIDKMMETIISVADENGNIPAKSFKRIREQIDSEISAAFNKDYKNYVEKAGVAARNQMMDDLIEAAARSGKPEYVEGMQEWSRKLQIAEKLKGYVGQNPDARARRIDSFVKNVFGENKERAREALGQLSEVIDDDLLKEARYASMASQMGSTGRPTLFSPVKTGSTVKGVGLGGAALFSAGAGNAPAALAAGAGFALSSPVISSKILGPMKGFSDMLSKNFKVNKGKADEMAKTIYRQVDDKAAKGLQLNQDELYKLINKTVPADIKSKTDPFWNMPLVGSAEDRAQSAARRIEMPMSVDMLTDQQSYLKKLKSDIWKDIKSKTDRDILTGMRTKGPKGERLRLSEEAYKRLQRVVDRIDGDPDLKRDLKNIGIGIPEHPDDIMGWIQSMDFGKGR